MHCQNPSLKGYSKRNLYNMVRFYETFSSESFLQESNEYQLDGFVQPVAAQIECGSANGFVQPTAARLEGVPKINPMPNFLTMTSYSNLMEILSYCRDAREQIFYMIYAHQHSLQKRELRKAIVSGTCANLLSDKKIQPKDFGQLEFYMEALDRDVKRANENPTIGILLCQTAEQTVVEYALSRSMSPTMVAEYRNRMIPREVLQKTLNEYIEMNN